MSWRSSFRGFFGGSLRNFFRSFFRNFGRIVRWAALGIFLLMLALISSVSTVVFTEPGSRWFIALAEKFLPVEVGAVKGNLLTGLDLEYLEYRVEQDGYLEQQYRAENISFRWQPLALMYSSVSVQSLRADTIKVLLPPVSDAQPEPAQWPSLALPVIVELGQLELDNIQVQRSQLDQPVQPLVQLRSVSGSLSLGAFNLRLADLAVVTDDYTVIADGRAGVRYPYDTQLAVQWQYELAASADQEALLLSGRGDLQGDVRQLALVHQLSLPFEIESQVTLVPNLSEPPAAIAAISSPQLSAVNQWPAQPLLQRWFPVDADIPIVAGQLQLDGWMEDYRAQLEAQVNYAALPPLAVSADARGDLTQIDIAELILQLSATAGGPARPDQPGAQARISGQVSWTPELRWDLALASTGLNPELYLPAWPGQLQLTANTRGSLTDAGMRIAVEDINLGGQLRALAVLAEGGAEFDGERWQTDGLSLSLGANHLRVNGGVGDVFDVQWYLNAPLLNQIDPGLQGTVFTQGHLQGSRDQPQLVMEMRAQQLRWQDLGVEQLLLELTPMPEGNYQFKLNAEELALAQQEIDTLAFTGSGSIAQSHLQGRISSSLGELELGLESGYQDQNWQGQFTSLDLRLANLPRWQLLRSAPMRANGQMFELGELCLTTRSRGRGQRSQTAETPEGAALAAPDDSHLDDQDETEEVAALCNRGHWSSASGLQLDTSLAAIPLRQLRAFIEPDVGVQGVIEGDLSLQIPTGAAPAATLNLRTRDGALRYQYADDPVETYRWETLALNGTLQNNVFNADLTNRWGEYGAIEGKVSLNTQSQALDGALQIDFTDLAPLGALVPVADDLAGSLAADIELSGTLPQPQVRGQISLTNGAAKIPRLGLDLRDIGLTLNSDGDGRIDLRSRVHSGEGFVQVDSELTDIGTPDWLLTGEVQGEKFVVIQQPEVEAQIEPAIQLRANQQEMHVTGETLIPFARVGLKTLPASATKVSDDVVILEGETRAPKDKMDFYLNVKARLGDDVSFNGFGLTSRLAGEMTLTQTPTRPLLVTGYVDVVDGKYKAYGQELNIERGQLIFQGPLDNPGLDIRAQRSLRGNADSIVGLEIGGTLQRPTSNVYSDPPLQNEGEAMALLLTGKPLAEASAGDAYTIISAMSGLGMDEGGSITAQIADAFSLDEFSLSAEDGLEHSSLMVGKYLTDRLLVRYVVGLFDQLSRIGVVYQMTDKLRVEAESGDVQSVDMIYKIER